MNQLVIFTAVPSVAVLCLCLLALFSGRRHSSGLFFVFLCLNTLILSLLYVYLADLDFEYDNPYIFAGLAAGWALFPAVLLNFSIRTAFDNKTSAGIISRIIYLPAVFFVYRGLEYREPSHVIYDHLLGWTAGPQLNEIWFWAYSGYFALYCATAALLLFLFVKKASSGYWRASSVVMAAGVLPVIGYVIAADLLFFDLLDNYTAMTAMLALFAWLVSVWFVVLRSPKEEASSVFSLEHLLEGVLGNMSDLLLVVDNDGRIVRANKSLLDMLGYEDSDMAGREVGDFVVEGGLLLRTLADVRHGFSRGCDLNMHFRHTDGQGIPVKMSSSLFYDGAGKSCGILMFGKPDLLVTPGKEINIGDPGPVAHAPEEAEICGPDMKAAVSEEIKLEEIKAEETKAEETKAEEIKPEEIKPEEIKPEEIKPEEIKPEEIKPEEIKPEEGGDGFRNLVDHALVGIFITINGRMIYANKKMAEIFGYAQDEISSSIHILELVDEVDRKGVADRIDKVIRTGRKSPYFTFRGRQKGGDIIDIEAQGLMGEFNGEQVFIGSLYEITERKMLEEAMRHEALHDPLTSLPNRILFCDRLNMAISKAEREKARVAVMFLDLDRFKNVNDTFGHNVGDMLLQSAAGVLNGCLRDSDSVARLGGDEFTALLSPVHNEEDIVKVARKILSSVNQRWIIAGHKLNITTSVGISVYPDDGMDAETLIRKADTAMYSAKAHGGNNIRLYSPFMDSGSAEQLRLESDLCVALDKNEFFLHYQPLFGLNSKKVEGAEVFVRWNHPELGVLLSEGFIPVAEKTGMIIAIGEWALNMSCRQVKKWHDRGYSSLDLAIHVSGVQLKEADFVDMVERTIEKTSFNPKRLKLEITENVALQNLDAITPKLVRLSTLGVQFAIDDFGMGYSSLHYLKRLPIKTVKIDKVFTRNLTKSDEDASIITAVIAMAKSLDLDTIAEGVETREQAALLRKCRCDSMQGQMYSRPLSPEAFEMFIG
jgi:diguanylate cyclase (GGDEF)-like protein/PAS domain S-box-containing protein